MDSFFAHHHYGRYYRCYTHTIYQTSPKLQIPTSNIHNTMNFFSQITIKYLTHIIFKRRRRQHHSHYKIKTGLYTKPQPQIYRLTLIISPPMKISTKPLPCPPWPYNHGMGWWTNITCQCTTYTNIFLFLFFFTILKIIGIEFITNHWPSLAKRVTMKL